MNNLKIKNYPNLEKDPTNGAILLSEDKSADSIRIENLMRRLTFVEKQNSHIIAQLNAIIKHLGVSLDSKDA